MTLYQKIFDKFVLPLFTPLVIARSLSTKEPIKAATILSGMNLDKCIRVLEHWSIGVQTIILNEMSEYTVKLLGAIGYENRAKLLMSLSSKIVKLYSNEITQEDLDGMINYWKEDDLRTALMRFSPNVGALLIVMLDDDQKSYVLRDLQPWMQASLMENLTMPEKAAMMDRFEFSNAIDLFTRWNLETQSEVIQFLSEPRQHELFRVLSPKAIGALLQLWEVEKVKEVILNLDEDRQKMTYYSLGKDMKFELFPLFAEGQQVSFLNGVEPMEAIHLMESVTKEEKDILMDQLDDDQATGIRMAIMLN